jgi:hypothetical protein
MLEAFALAANLAFAQPKNPFGFNGWAHLRNQVSPPAVDHFPSLPNCVDGVA